MWELNKSRENFDCHNAIAIESMTSKLMTVLPELKLD